MKYPAEESFHLASHTFSLMSNSCIHHKCMLFVHTLNSIQARYIQALKNEIAKIFLYAKTCFINLLRFDIRKITSYLITREYMLRTSGKKKEKGDEYNISHHQNGTFASIRQGNFIPIGIRLNGFKPLDVISRGKQHQKDFRIFLIRVRVVRRHSSADISRLKAS